MGLHLILTFICLFLAIYFLADSLHSYNEREGSLGYGMLFVIIFLFLFIFYLVGLEKMSKAPWEYPDKPYATEKIVALSDSNMTNGQFYMRRGYIDTDLYYQYFVDVGGGGYKANKVKSDISTIYYSDGNYRVEWYEKTRSWLWFSEEATYHKVYIPEGSLTDTYSVDLQ